MAEKLLNAFYIRSGRKCDGGGRVPEIMKTEIRAAHLLNHSFELSVERREAYTPPDEIRENKVVRIAPQFARGHSVYILLLLFGFQIFDQYGRHEDHPCSVALGALLNKVLPRLHVPLKLLRYCYTLVLEIYIIP